MAAVCIGAAGLCSVSGRAIAENFLLPDNG